MKPFKKLNWHLIKTFLNRALGDDDVITYVNREVGRWVKR